MLGLGPPGLQRKSRLADFSIAMTWWRYERTGFTGITLSYLKQLAEAGEADELLEWLDTPTAQQNPLVRRRIVHAMAHMKPGGGWITLKPVIDDRFFATICELAKADPDVDVRRAAVMALAFSDDEAVIPILLSALRAADEPTQGWGIYGLGNLCAKEGVEPLIGLLRPYRKGTSMVVDALVKIRNERAIQPLREAACATWLPWRRRRLEKAADKLARSVGLTPYE